MTWENLSAPEIARAVMGDSIDGVVVIAPIVVRADVARPYFMLATMDPDGFCAARIEVNDADDRTAVIMEILRIDHPVGFAVHDVDDELEAARLCARLWPGPQTEELLRSAEQERARALS